MHEKLKAEINATSSSMQYRNLLLEEYTWRDEIHQCEENTNLHPKFQLNAINIRLTALQNRPP
jgi:hypothetical protein